MKQRKKLNLTTQYVLVFGALLLAANILLGLVLLNQSRNTLRAMLEKNMLDITNTAAGLMDGDRLGALTADDVDGPYFGEVIRTLTVFQERVEIDYIYAVKQVGEEEFVFTVDPDPVDPGEFGEEIIYTEALGLAGRGISAVDRTAAADRWGSFYSAYCPVYDSQGRVAGIIGVDFDAEWYDQQIRGFSITVLMISALTVLIGAAVVILITNRTRKRFRNLSDELSTLSGDVEELTKIITSNPGYQESLAQNALNRPGGQALAPSNDEIGVLSDKIRSMETAIQAYLDYMHAQANTDALTGVGNTTAYQGRIRALEDQLRAGSGSFAVALFDVDRLKEINDELGHVRGDMVIRAAAAVLSRVFGRDNVYRVGGDEFVALAEPATEAEVEQRLARVQTAAAQFTMPDKSCDGRLSLSSGAAVCRPGEDQTYREVFVRADEAMYRCKHAHHVPNRNRAAEE